MRLLILSCSARKRPLRPSAPAMELYDGPLYRSLRRLAARGAWPPDTTIRIVSAKYGVIAPNTPIRPYDRRLVPARDAALIATSRTTLRRLINRLRPAEVCINLSRDYEAVVPNQALARSTVTRISGPPGQRVRDVLNWLGAEAAE